MTDSARRVPDPGQFGGRTPGSDTPAGQPGVAYNPRPLLVFGQQPTTTAHGSVITPAVTVQAQNALGAILTGISGCVTMVLGSILGGTLTQPFVNGVATFNDLTVATAGSYKLQANAGWFLPILSSTFTVT
jgi:hypothetical protein